MIGFLFGTYFAVSFKNAYTYFTLDMNPLGNAELSTVYFFYYRN